MAASVFVRIGLGTGNPAPRSMADTMGCAHEDRADVKFAATQRDATHGPIVEFGKTILRAGYRQRELLSRRQRAGHPNSDATGGEIYQLRVD
jgi:hypothetical protein